jgi:hypothetical protein
MGLPVREQTTFLSFHITYSSKERLSRQVQDAPPMFGSEQVPSLLHLHYRVLFFTILTLDFPHCHAKERRGTPYGLALPDTVKYSPPNGSPWSEKPIGFLV